MTRGNQGGRGNTKGYTWPRYTCDCGREVAGSADRGGSLRIWIRRHNTPHGKPCGRRYIYR